MKEAVILLHGLGRTKNSMNKIEKYFSEEYDVYNIGYNSLKYPIEVLVEKYLLDIVKELNEKEQKINFVTHSMGGILVRYLFKIYEIKNFRSSGICQGRPPSRPMTPFVAAATTPLDDSGRRPRARMGQHGVGAIARAGA